MRKLHIGIIGGGLAGLTAAYQLSKKNCLLDTELQITLLEATNRIGGRVYTLRQFSPGIYAEAGALLIGNNEFETLELIRELNLELLERPDMLTMKYCSPGGKYVPWMESQPGIFFKKYILDSIPQQESLRFNNEILNHTSMLDFLKVKARENNDDISQVIQAAEISLLGIYCDDLSKLSALDGLRYLNHYRHTKQFFSIKGGNDQLPITLENNLQKNGVFIIKNMPVIKVARPSSDAKPPSVKIIAIDQTTQQNKVFKFDYVIIATPLSALQTKQPNQPKKNYLEFSPSLPMKRRKAIDAIYYNLSMARLYYELDRRFWTMENPDMATLIINRPTLWIENHSTHLTEKNSAILEIHAAGNMGKMLQNDAQIWRTAKEELVSIWGETQIDSYLNSTSPVAIFWLKEFYQQGAYPYFGVGQAYYPSLLKEKLPALSFAGEYTSLSCHGTMIGAIRSAYRAVDEVKAAFT